MKKLIFLILVSFIFVNSVLALDCQYTEIEQNERQRIEYYLDGTLADIAPPFVNVTDIWDGKLTIGTARNYKITLKSYVAEPLNVTLRYNAEGSQREHKFTLDPLASKIIEGSYSQDLPFFDSESIRIEVDNLNQKEISYLENIEVCKKCENQICLNDGDSCNSLYDNSKCGSGICNIAGFCGNKKIVNCTEGYFNCNNKKCLKRNYIDYPGNVEIGCEDACVHSGINGTCLENPILVKEREDSTKRNWIILGVLLLAISSVLIGKFALMPYIKRRKEEEGKREEAKKQREDEEGRRDKAREEYENILTKKELAEKEILEHNRILNLLKKETEKIRENIMDEKEKSKKRIEEIKIKEREEIKKWEDKKKNKSAEAKKVIDEEIAEVRAKRKNEIESVEKDFEKTKDNLIYQIGENKRLSLEEERKKREKEETIKKIEDSKKLMNEFHLNDQRFRVRLNEKGYEILENGNLFHLFWYCKNSNEKQKDLEDFEIHHIDGDKRNNDYSNLIKIDKFTHKDIHEHNTRWIGYRKGVEILNRYKIKLPERVIEELGKIEKRASINARKSGLKRRV